MYKVLRQWSKNTTCHGVTDVAESKSSSGKLLWICLILISLTAMSYQLFTLFENYSDSNKWMSTMYEERTLGGIDFPTITVCDFNRLRRSKVKKYNMTDDLIQFLFYTNGIRYTMAKQPDDNDRSRFSAWRKEQGLSYKDIFDKMGSTCEETFKYANIRSLRTSQPCSASWLNITPVLTIEYGKCFQVRLNTFRRVSLSGGSWGLTLVLNLQLSEYLPVLINNYNDEGFALQLNYGDGVEFGSWLALSPGLHSWVAMTPTHVKTRRRHMFTLFPPPCLYNPSLKVLPGHYSRKQCEFDCIMQAVVNSCGCVFRITTDKYPTCDMDYYDKCNDKTDVKSIRGCRNQCMDPCEEKRLRASVSYSRAVSIAQTPKLRTFVFENEDSTKSDAEVRSEFMSFDVYYDTVSVTVIERYEFMTLQQLISNIGGQLGLWAGISVLTIYQTIVYLFRAVLSSSSQHLNAKKSKGSL